MSGQQGLSEVLVELGRCLVALRRVAGLSQWALVRRMDRAEKTAQPLISRLETGKEPNPGLCLVLDYLRACRAGPEEIVEVLRRYTSRPTRLEERGTEAVAKVAAALPCKVQAEVVRQDVREAVGRRFAGEEPEGVEERMLRARRRAAAAGRRNTMLWFVNDELSAENIGFVPTLVQRSHLVNHARKVWGILLRTRRSRPGRRDELLAKAPEWLKGHMPEIAVEFVQFVTLRVFRTMEISGDLDRLPEPGEATDGVAAQEHHRQMLREFMDARRKVMDSIIVEAHELLLREGVPEGKLGLYDHTVRFFCHLADAYGEDDARRAVEIERHVEEPRFLKRGRKPELCCKVGAFVLRRYAELKKTLPPEPGRQRRGLLLRGRLGV